MRQPRAGDEALKFAMKCRSQREEALINFRFPIPDSRFRCLNYVTSAPTGKFFGKCACVQLNELGAGPGAGFDLLLVRRDEQAHLDAGVIHFFARLGQRLFSGDHVQSAFRRHFQPALRHDADNVRLQLSDAISMISGALAISRFSRVLTTSRNSQTSRSWMCRRSSRKCAVMP